MKPFEVGERVRIYTNPEFCHPRDHTDGTVKGVCEDPNYIMVRIDPARTDRGTYSFHVKQCRRLIPKKRREIWVSESTFMYLNNPKYGIYSVPPHCAAIKFRECK